MLLQGLAQLLQLVDDVLPMPSTHVNRVLFMQLLAYAALSAPVQVFISPHCCMAWQLLIKRSHTKLMITGHEDAFNSTFGGSNPLSGWGPLPPTVSSILATRSLFDSGQWQAASSGYLRVQ
jgi:hypothetical protein